ncbi:SET domain-containing protein 4 [Chamberlinius hualienensis]
MAPENVVKVDQLIEWLKHNNFILPPHVQLVYLDDVQGYGIISKKDVDAGETVFTIPKSLLIIPQILNEYVKRVDGFEWKRNAFHSLTVWLMIERCCFLRSSWAPYIRLLPRSFNTPPFYPSSVLKCFPAHLSVRLQEQRRRISAEFRDLRPSLLQLQMANGLPAAFSSYKLFRWAWCCVNTRCVSMPNGQMALAPFLDFLNHCHSQEVSKSGFDEKLELYKVLSACKVAANSQVFISYGPHSNFTLAMEYGFIIPSNKSSSTVQFSFDELLSATGNRDVPAKHKNEIVSRQLHLDLCFTHSGPSWCLVEAAALLNELQPHNVLSKLIDERMRQLKIAKCEKRRSKKWSYLIWMASMLINEEMEILLANVNHVKFK